MTAFQTITVDIPSETAELLQEAVASGAFVSAGEAIAAAVRLWRDQQDDLFGYTPDELDRLIDEGIASGPGQGSSIEEIARESFRRAGVPYPEV